MDEKPWPPPKSKSTLDHLKYISTHDQFIKPPNSWEISPALAKQMAYKLPRNVSVGDPEGDKDVS